MNITESKIIKEDFGYIAQNPLVFLPKNIQKTEIAIEHLTFYVN